MLPNKVYLLDKQINLYYNIIKTDIKIMAWSEKARRI